MAMTEKERLLLEAAMKKGSSDKYSSMMDNSAFSPDNDNRKVAEAALNSVMSQSEMGQLLRNATSTTAGAPVDPRAAVGRGLSFDPVIRAIKNPLDATKAAIYTVTGEAMPFIQGATTATIAGIADAAGKAAEAGIVDDGVSLAPPKMAINPDKLDKDFVLARDIVKRDLERATMMQPEVARHATPAALAATIPVMMAAAPATIGAATARYTLPRAAAAFAGGAAESMMSQPSEYGKITNPKDLLNEQTLTEAALATLIGPALIKSGVEKSTKILPADIPAEKISTPTKVVPNKYVAEMRAKERIDIKNEYNRRVAEGTNKEITVKNGNLVYTDGTPVQTFRGTADPDIFVTKENAPKPGGEGKMMRLPETYFFSDNRDLAAEYAIKSRRPPDKTGQYPLSEKNLFEAQIKMQKPLIIDAKGTPFNKIPFDFNDGKGMRLVDTNNLAEYGKNNGYDGIIINNIYDTGKSAPTPERIAKLFGNVVISLKKDNVKNPVLIGKAGNRGIRYTDPIHEMPYASFKDYIQTTDKPKTEASLLRERAFNEARDILAEEEYQKQFSPEIAAEAAKKEGSKRFWASRPDPELNLGVDEVDKIIKDPTHPLLREPIQAAANADKGYQLALREWQPNKKTPRRNAEQIILMNSGLAPLSRSKLAERTIDQYDADGKLIPEDELLELLMEDAPTELWKPVNDRVVTGKLENPNLTWKRNDSFGSGASGRVYPVIDRNGNRKVAKISIGQFNSDIATHIFEKEAARAVQNVRANATPNEKSLYLKHFPDFEQILDRPDSSTGYIFVMDELRPMNDIEKAELFDGRKILKELLEKKGYKNVDEYMNATGEDFRLPSSHNIAVMPKTPHEVPGYRRTLTANDYDNMTPRVRSFYKALEYMSGEHGIGWGDMHPGNVMINPKTGDYVAADIGNYNQRNNNDYYRFQLEQTKAEAAGRAARQGDAEALAADIAENEIIARARAADKDIKALPPDEMARRFTKPTGSAGAMAAERGYPENEAGQLQMWSNQRMAGKDVSNPTEAAIKRYMSDFADAGIPEPNRIPTAENYENWFASTQRRLVNMTDKAFKMPRGPEKDILLSQISDMTSWLEGLRDQRRWRSTENAEQMSFDFPEAGNAKREERLREAARQVLIQQGLVRPKGK